MVNRLIASGVVSLVLTAVVGFEAVAADLSFAHGLYRDKRYQLAVDEYQAFLKGKPDEASAAEARFYLAESLVQLDKYADAIPVYSVLAAEENRKSTYYKQSLLRLATLRCAQGDAAGGATALKRYVAQFPDDPGLGAAWCSLGDAQLGANDLRGAADSFREARTRAGEGDPIRFRALLGTAKVAVKVGGKADAKAAFEAVAKGSDPDVAAEAKFSLGVLAFEDQQFDDAAKAFGRVASEHAKHPLAAKAKLNRALSLLQTTDRRGAEASLAAIGAASKEEFPDDIRAEAVFQLLLAQRSAARWNDAAGTAKQGLEQFSKSVRGPEFEYYAAATELDAGRAGPALETITKFLVEHARHPLKEQALYSLCRASLASGKPKEAAAAYARLVRDFPDGEWRPRAVALLASAGELKDLSEIDRSIDATKDPATKNRLRYARASELFRSRKYEAAAQSLKEVLANDPEAGLAVDSRYLYGLSLAKLERWPDSIRELTAYLDSSASSRTAEAAAFAAAECGRALGRLPRDEMADAVDGLRRKFASDPSIVAGLAEGLVDARQGAAAAPLFEEALKGSKPLANQARTLLAYVRCLIELKKWEEAARRLDAASGGDPAESSYLRGIVLAGKGDATGARAEFRVVVEKYADAPFAADARLRLARLSAAANEWTEAEKQFKALVESAAPEKRPTLLLEQATAAADAGRTLDAMAMLKAVASDYPSSPEAGDAMLKLAELHQDRKEYVQAETLLADLEKRPGTDVPALLYRLGAIAYRQRKADVATKRLEDLIRRFGTSKAAAAAEFLLGEMDLEALRGDAALRRFNALLERSDAADLHGTARLRVGQCLLLLRKWQEAEAAAEKVLASKPTAEQRLEALYVQGRALQQQAQFEPAREKYSQIASDGRSELAAKAGFMTGETWFHQKKYAEALKAYLKVALTSSYPEWQAASLLQAGKCHELRRERDDAVRTFGQLIERFPQSPAAAQAKERLAALQGSTTSR